MGANRLLQRMQRQPVKPRTRLSPQLRLAILLSAVLAIIVSLFTSLPLLGLALGGAVAAASLLALPRWQRRRSAERARTELKVAIDQLVSALRSGRSLVTALEDWPRELSQALGPGRWVMPGEVEQMREHLAGGATPEEALAALADRLSLDEMRVLTRTITLCRRRGGDLAQAVAQAGQMLAEVLEVKAKMKSLTAGKRAEGVIVTLFPLILLLILGISDPDYVAPLFHTHIGRLMLVAALILEACAVIAALWLLQPDL